MEDHLSQAHALGFFSHVSHDTARALCMSAGDWSLLAASEVERVLTKERNRRPEAFAEGINELTRRSAITATDASVLQDLMKHVFAAIREKADPEASRAAIVGCYLKLCADRDASPAALAITSTVVRALERRSAEPAREGSKAVAREVSVGGAIIYGAAGALIGAGIGSAFGPIGAGVGALIGGAVGAGISISNDKGV